MMIVGSNSGAVTSPSKTPRPAKLWRAIAYAAAVPRTRETAVTALESSRLVRRPC